MKKIDPWFGKRTVKSRSCSCFCYYRHEDGTHGVNFQVLTPMSKISYSLEETLPGVVTVTTKSADRALLKKNGFVSLVSKEVYVTAHFFRAVQNELQHIRNLQEKFGDDVKISAVFHFSEL